MSYSAGFIGSFFTMSQIDAWYQFINKPSFNPPNWVFGPVWSILYLLMAISIYLFWKKGLNTRYQKDIFKLFVLNLLLNSLWSIVFFGFHSPTLALAIIIGLLYTIFLLIKRFLGDFSVSAYLLVPYFLWVTFATMLNIAIVILN